LGSVKGPGRVFHSTQIVADIPQIFDPTLGILCTALAQQFPPQVRVP